MTPEAIREAAKKITDNCRQTCSKCEGDGRLWADGKSHYFSENRPTVECGHCGGKGEVNVAPTNEIESLCLRVAEEARREALEEAAKECESSFMADDECDKCGHIPQRVIADSIRSLMKEGK
jgi:hypothetical protein